MSIQTIHTKSYFIIGLLLSAFLTVSANETPNDLPELDEIQSILQADRPPTGILFTIYEYEEDALEWVIPRLSHYVDLIRRSFPALPIAVVSHGDEILTLTREQASIYQDIHKKIKNLVKRQHISFHICGSYAAYNGLSEEDFPEYIDVVPFGPSQITDYEAIGYELIELGLTW